MRIELHHTVPNRVNERRKRHRRARMHRLGLLHRIDGEPANDVDSQLIHLRRSNLLDQLSDTHLSTPCGVLLIGSLAFERRYLAKPPDVPLGSAKSGCQEGVNEVLGHSRTDDPAAHAHDVHVVVFHSLPGREVIVNQPRADARNFVGTHRGTDAAAADSHTPLHASGNNRPGQRDNEVGIVIAGINLESADVNQFMAGFAKMGDQFFLQRKSGVIRGNPHSHVMPPF
jgi:hypothetical protein